MATNDRLPGDDKISSSDPGIAFGFSSEAMNQLILRAAGEGIYGVNAEGKTTFVNPAAERMLGSAADELVGRVIHPNLHHTHHDERHYPDHDCPTYAALRASSVDHIGGELFC